MATKYELNTRYEKLRNKANLAYVKFQKANTPKQRERAHKEWVDACIKADNFLMNNDF